MRSAQKQNLEQAAAKANDEFASAVQAGWSKRRAAAIAAQSDWEEVVERPDLSISMTMADCVLRTPNGAAVAYHLGQNPEEATRIARLPPAAQLVEMGKLSAQVAASPPAAPVSRAPQQRVRQSQPARREESMAEYASRRTKELAEARRR
jgi:hypothetical protein